MLEKTIQIAKEAGSIIRANFGKISTIEYKSDETDLVTNVDKESERKIIELIKKDYPNHSILAEESGVEKKSSEYKWVIDPIDGTTNFAIGLPIFSVSIGVQKNDETIIGVVYDVMRDTIYAAEKGSGSYENGKQIQVNSNSKLTKGVLVTGFAYDKSDKYVDAVKIFGALLNKTRAIRRLGSAAIDFCYVASGVFEGFWEANLSPWDVCAGKLIVEEAGGVVTNFKNESINIYSNQFLATNGKIHSEMLNVFAEFGK